jgi:hypothetical protein
VFDSPKGYHQIPLLMIPKIMTPFICFCYIRLAFSLNSAGDVFTLRYRNAIDKATDGLRATEDTLIRGSTMSELVKNTRKFVKTCQENGITLNMLKSNGSRKKFCLAVFSLIPPVTDQTHRPIKLYCSFLLQPFQPTSCHSWV